MTYGDLYFDVWMAGFDKTLRARATGARDAARSLYRFAVDMPKRCRRCSRFTRGSRDFCRRCPS